MAINIGRRELMAALGGAAVAWPLAARAQQPTPPVIGFLGSASPETYSNCLAAFRQGLDDTGFVEPQNCRIEFRWARDQIDLLPALATELVNHKPAVIMTAGGLSSALAAQAATSTIPIVFAAVSDPVGVGLVASYSRPGGNITGVDALLGDTNAKRLELLRELVPRAEVIGVLANPSRPDASAQLDDIEAVAAKLGQKILVERAGTASDISIAIAKLVQQGVGAF
jgi:putative tryptophan/tyrosine transport system substrate-binding protein